MRNYFALEDPNEITPVGIELTLEARVGGMRLRGIIDRLDRTADGELVVIDYKTGRAPSPAFEQSKLIGVHIYALLCQEVLGRRPVQVKLLHLKEPTTIIAEPSEQALRGQRQKAVAVWSAIERACRERGLPAPDLAPVQLLPVPGLLSGLRRKPRRCVPGARAPACGAPDMTTDDTHRGCPTARPEPAADPPPASLGVVETLDDEGRPLVRATAGEPGARRGGQGDHRARGPRTDVGGHHRVAGPAHRTRPGPGRAGAGHRRGGVQPGQHRPEGRGRPIPARPVGAAGHRPGGVPVREPKTSSFPSGHTLAAFCAATVMSQTGRSGRGNALLFTSASLVGLSRLHLRAHHASDVVGGAAIGVAIGLVGRRLRS